MTQTIIATLENGVLKPAQPLNLPDHAQVRLTIELAVDTEHDQSNAMTKIYEILSRRYASGHTDTAEWHDEHQP